MQVVSTTMALDLIIRCNSVYLPIVACVRDRLGVYLMILAASRVLNPHDESVFSIFIRRQILQQCLFIGYTETHKD